MHANRNFDPLVAFPPPGGLGLSLVLFAFGFLQAFGEVGNYSLYVDENRSLWAMGDNDNGQLGDGNLTDRNQTYKISTGGGVVDFAHGMDHTLYVQDDGSLWVIGDNAYGQLGDGSTTDRNSSYRIVDANVTAVAAGMHHSVFLKRDGSLWTMGRNDYGQLGNGNGAQQTTPQHIVVAGVLSISAGGHHTCFVKADGSLWTSGLNANGQLGNGFTNNLITPALIEYSGVSAVAAGGSHTLYLKRDGSLWAMGYNAYGQLGDDNNTDQSTSLKVVEANVTAIAAGSNHSFYLDANGSLWGAGYNAHGQLGDGTTSDRNVSFVEIVEANVTGVSAGSGHSLYLDANGSLWAMGLNSDGQLGLGDDANRTSPVEVVASGAYRLPGHGVLEGHGSSFSLYADVNGSLWGMGQNDNGEMGLPGLADRNVSSQVEASAVRSFSEGADYSLFVKTDGSLWGMGYNAHGQLGDGTVLDRNASVQIRASGVSQVSASGSNRFSLFLEDNGSLYGMGLNHKGELGLGDTVQRLTPTHVIDSVVSFAAGYDHTLFVKGDGSLWSMGSNAYGQLGDGSTTDRSLPVKIVDANVTAVAAGDGHSLFLKRDGSVWTMGRNDYGQLGDGNLTSRATPASVYSFGILAVAAGAHSSFFIKSGGSLWSMGQNDSGQLGFWDTTGRVYPTKAVSASVTAVSARQSHTLILKTDSLWATGLNADGQLGLGDLIFRSGFYVVESSGVGTISGVFTQGGSPPAFTSYEAAATVSVSKAENDGTSVVATIAAYDPEEHPISYSISGGADGDLFEVNATGNMEVSLDSGEEVNASVGLLQFKVYPDYEHPDDADLDNIYEVIVRASDGNKTTDQVFTVTVNDSNTSAMTDSNEGAMTDSNESSLTFTFTNAGVSGRSGPTQVDANYTGTALQGAVTVNTQGIQEWTVPYKALYRIEVLGARGGSIQGFFSGGRGARSVGVFDLNVSTQLKILVGQEGVNASAAGAGGGGGSFVTYADNVALLVAGGGGGAGTDQTGGDASPEEQPGPWNIHGTSQLKGGGNVNGGGGLDNGAGDGIYGGRAFASSGLGGDSSIGGGFGGGGAAVSDYGGGGGGYSGGNGGVTHTSNFAGQGGGSYQGDAKGFLAAGYSDGNGSVLITLVKSLNFIPRDIFHGTLYVEENATLGTIVGDFNGTDDDVNATLAFSLVDGNGSTHNSFFTIDANGTLSTAAALDYETDSNMSVRLRVTDNHNAISEAPFVINVTDVDDESPVITLNGAASVTFEANATFPDPAAVAADNNDSDVTVYGAGNLLANVPGTYVLTYDLNDTSGNAATQVKRTVTVVDTTPPVITLNGDANRTYEASPKYIDDNATWVDFVDGNGTVFPTGEVNASKLGEYDLTYDLNDTSGNAATQVTRTVTIVDTTLPVITILEDANASHEAGKVYLDPGAVWSDNLDGNGTIKINSIQGGVNEGRQDVYYITYSHTDSSGNVADLKTRKITVADKTSPVITLNGYANLTYEAGPEYVDANATWIDILDGNGTVFPTGEVNASKLGTYVLNYARTDATGNMATEVIRTVQVVDTTAPVLTFEGNSSIRHRVFQPYVDLGVHATDSFDGKLAVFVDASDLNIADPGDYNVTFSATDNASNKAVPFVRRVEVSNEAPIGIEQRIIQLGEGFGSDSSVAVLSPYDINESNNSYSLVAGTGSTDNAVFTLENNGSLRPKSPLDFESNSSYSIRIRWGDEYGVGNMVEEVLTIKDSPSCIAQKVVRIEEGFTSGELAYVFSTLDPDDLNSTRPYAYSLVEGTGSSDNVSFELEANGSLRAKGVLDFESKSSYSIRVRSVDEFGADVDQPLTLELADAFLPNLDTELATVLGPTSATLYGKVVDAGHTLGILERGFVVSRKTDPALGEQDALKISVAIDSETSFSSTVSDLSASKRYYFRAFATNKEGTGYGAQESFDLNASNDTQIWSNGTESDPINAPNWWASPWFGSFAVTEGTDWVFHEQYAWLFIFPQEGGGLWYWQKNLGWLWTASELYPYVYRQGFGWHYFLGASDGSVFLFSYPDEIWIDVARETDR